MGGSLGALIGSYAADIGAYNSIATLSGTGSSGTISFTSIPSNYKHLQFRFYSLSTGAADWVFTRLNNDTTAANYRQHRLWGIGSGTPSSQTNSGQASIMYNFIGGSTTQPSTGIIDIFDYVNTNKNKTMRTLFGWDTNGGGEVDLISVLYMSTSAINRVDFILQSSSFATSTRIALYGIKG
jgi:hypothetical protein